MWTQNPHLAGNTGLSRYYDFGEGSAIGALSDENDIHRQVAAWQRQAEVRKRSMQ